MAALNVAKVYFDDDDVLTCFAGAAVIGSRFVSVSASGTPTVNGNKPTVSLTGAGLAGCGVSAADQATVGGDVEVYTEGIVGVLCSGGLTAGQRVQAGANGVAVVFAAGFVFGTATATVADGVICPVMLQGL